ncbi:archaeosine synthase subunit alpha [Halorussus gelatinilyticus]|uniref:Archaeosine synthase subunit alpha n=1 Tax=Halorussus gelatinilyticus TaxID=2937524 RepID=A0A8U0IMH5_9EURY|nr:archaeosine synthase subunit alpha [Halorussus gelatinilyticus]UPW01209.1 archaeosine synthase subunit alpha [Halorussus gelatinilyticus]
MTDYFEVHERDGAARVAELRLADSVTTPAIADDFLRDAGSLWTGDREVPEGSDDELTILPHRGFPSGTDEEVMDSFAVEYPDVDYPSAAVVAPETADDFGTDAYVLSGARGFVGHGAGFREAIVRTREAIPADGALYLPGVATPANVATLVYAGVDLVDTDAAVVAGTEGKYLTSEGTHYLDDLSELPCACPACQQPLSEFTRQDCADHNENALKAELGVVRERIRAGRLRDYIEGQARHEQWLTAAFREFDQQWSYLEERTPLIRDSELSAATEDTLQRVEIKRFADRVTTRYRSRFDNPLVLVPCSAAKPYSESQSHGQFHDAIQFRGHTVSMTSPIGVVPQELELTYPAQHYDSVVTGRWSEDEKQFVAEVLRRYLERNDYPRVIAHVPPEGYRDVCERVEAELGMGFEYTVEDHPTTTESLGNLMRTLDGELKYGKRERQHNTVRAIADYQFGPGAGDALFDEIRTEARYPKLRVHDADGEQLAAMVPQYGVLSFTLAGARRWVESDAPTKRVEIDSFAPHGSVLAPGVVDADDDVRVGDEVVVEGPKAFAVGRAEMSGPEMAESTRGIATTVRHVEEK